MALIQPTPTPTPLTTAQLQAQLKSQAVAQMNQFYRQSIFVFNTLMTQIWNNAGGLTPQQALDSFGTDAGTLVTYGGLLAGLINSVTPNTVSTTTPAPLTTNAAGTVTVGTVTPPASSVKK